LEGCWKKEREIPRYLGRKRQGARYGAPTQAKRETKEKHGFKEKKEHGFKNPPLQKPDTAELGLRVGAARRGAAL
jgi:hypothetical protein